MNGRIPLIGESDPVIGKRWQITAMRITMRFEGDHAHPGTLE
jgi:hypothetical protein